MMKIIASLFIFGLCANVVFAGSGVAPTSSSQSGAFSSTYLNSTAIKVWNVGNTTDAAIFDSTATTNNGAGISPGDIWFGPGATNDTSYVWGIPSSGITTSSAAITVGTQSEYSTVISSIHKRTLNNTIVGWGNDTTELSVVGDASISTSIQAGQGYKPAIGPGYLAFISAGTDTVAGGVTANNQVYVTLVGGVSGSASTTKLTTTADVQASSATVTPQLACTSTSFTPGNIWYDIGSGAFFYTYWKSVVTSSATTVASTCGTSTTTTANTIYLGGIYVNGTAFWTTPLAITPTTAAHGISALMGGGDNSLNATNIYVVYKDSTISPATTYVSKTSKSSSVTTGGSPSTLIADSTSGTQNSASSTYMTYTYSPVSVWASNFTYGITVSQKNGSQTQTQYSNSATTFTYVYSFTNFLNGTTTAADSGLASSGNIGASAFYGWQLNTGYASLAVFEGATADSYVLGTFYGNGTVNMTAATIATLTYDYVSLYEDVNGTLWIGWQDVDTANSEDWTYAGYLAKFQGQLNVPSSGASIFSIISALFAMLAAIFIF